MTPRSPRAPPKRVDAVAVPRDRPELGGLDDEVILRAASEERRVVVTNDVRDYVGLVEDFGLRGESHFGVLLTSDSAFARSKHAVGLLVDALEAFVQDAPDDDLLGLPRERA